MPFLKYRHQQHPNLSDLQTTSCFWYVHKKEDDNIFLPLSTSTFYRVFSTFVVVVSYIICRKWIHRTIWISLLSFFSLSSLPSFFSRVLGHFFDTFPRRRAHLLRWPLSLSYSLTFYTALQPYPFHSSCCALSVPWLTIRHNTPEVFLFPSCRLSGS